MKPVKKEEPLEQAVRLNSSDLKEYTLEDVDWREYDFSGRIYKIWGPIKFWHRSGGETHRVLDSAGIVHIVPAPGINGCVMRYKKTEGADPCQF